MKTSLSLAILLLAIQPVYAQERSAGGTLEAQMSWSALSSKIASTDTKANALNSQLQQAVVCGKRGKLYAPGDPASDSSGCKKISVDISSDPDIVSIKKTLKNLESNVDNSVTYNVKEQKCSKQGYVYAPGLSISDPNGCLKPKTGKDCTMDKEMACGGKTNCVVAARTPFRLKGGGIYVHTQVPTVWKDGETYIWHYDNTQNDHGGGQCIDGTIRYFTTGT